MFNQLVNIAGINMSVIECQDQQVITLHMMDIVYGQKSGTAKRAFNRNKNELILKQDYGFLTGKQLANFLILLTMNSTSVVRTNNPLKVRNLVILYKTGYLRIAKSFRASQEITKQICQKYFGDKSITFLGTQSHEDKFGIFLKQSLEDIATVNTQVVIQDYRVDFLLPEYGIVIEYDEEQHGTVAHQNKDKERDKALSILGYTIIRVNKRESYGVAINRILKILFVFREYHNSKSKCVESTQLT